MAPRGQLALRTATVDVAPTTTPEDAAADAAPDLERGGAAASGAERARGGDGDGGDGDAAEPAPDEAADVSLYPRLHWLTCVFRDPATEAAYVEQYVRPQLEIAIWRLGLCGLGVFGLGLAWHAAAAEARADPIGLYARLASTLACALAAAYALAVRRAPALSAPLPASEAVFGCALALVVAAEPGAVGWAARGAADAASPLILARTLVLLGLAMVLAPLRARLVAPLLAGALALDSVAWLALPAEARTRLGAAYALLVLVLACARLRLARYERERYHLRTAVAAALIAARRVRSAEHDAELQLQTARAASQARSRLIRIVMHDLRSPLLSVINLSASLREDEALAARAPQRRPPSAAAEAEAARGRAEALEGLETCASLMEAIVSDMLDFERIDSGRLVLVPAPFQLADLLRAARVTFQGVADAKGVRLSAEPPAGWLGACWLVGDVRRLQQCLNNGVSNALKFTDAGGSVAIRAWAPDEQPHAVAPPAELPVQPPAAPCGASEAAVAAVAAAAAAAAGCDGPSARSSTRSSERSARSSVLAGSGPSERSARASLLAPPPPPLGLRDVRVSVVDSGAGLDASELATLQKGEIFQQVGKGQLQGNGGAGLGLGISRQLLRLHGDGCELRLHSDGTNAGTTFEMQLRLPVHALGALGCDSAACTSAKMRRRVAATEPSGLGRHAHHAGAGAHVRRARTSPTHRSGEHRHLVWPTGAPPQPLPPLQPPAQRAVADADADADDADAGGKDDGEEEAYSFAKRAPRAADVGEAGVRPGFASSPAACRRSERAGSAAGGWSGGLREAAPPPALPRIASASPSTAPGSGEPLSRNFRHRRASASLESATAAAAAAAAAPAGGAGGVVSGKLQFPEGFRCLYVEDDRILQRSLPARTFKKVGAPYDVAADGEEAVRMVMDGPHDYALIVMDNQMPRMTGAVATRTLRHGGYGGVIIGMTGDPVGCPERDEFEAAGLDASLDKDNAGVRRVLTVLAACAVDSAGASTRDTAEEAGEEEARGAEPLLSAAATRPRAAAAPVGTPPAALAAEAGTVLQQVSAHRQEARRADEAEQPGRRAA